MRFAASVVLLPLLYGPSSVLPFTGTLVAQSQPAAASSDSLPSAILQPSIDTLTQTIGAIKLDKWKNGSIRSEAVPNLESIQKDLQTVLPSLLKDADATPNSMSAVLPVLRNVDALYDVVLRVMDGARVVAPAEQGNALQDALTGLDKGRRAIHDRLMVQASGQEKQVKDLQMIIKNQPPQPVCPVVPPPDTKPAAKKKVAKKKPVTPGAQPSASPAGTTKPNP